MKKKKVVLVAGYAGVGKTTLSRWIVKFMDDPAAFIDKDVFAPMVEALNVQLGLEANDRYSKVYAEQVRPLEYRALFDLIAHNLGVDSNVVAVAPFLSELNTPGWLEWFRRDMASHKAEVIVVWVTCSKETMRSRLTTRASARDDYKLVNWDGYAASIIDLRHIADSVAVNDDPSYSLKDWLQSQDWINSSRPVARQ